MPHFAEWGANPSTPAVALRRIGPLDDTRSFQVRLAAEVLFGALYDDKVATRARSLLAELQFVMYEPEVPVDVSAVFLPYRKRLAILPSALDGVYGAFDDPAQVLDWIAIHEAVHLLDFVTDFRCSTWFGHRVGSRWSEPGSTNANYVPGRREDIGYSTTLVGSKSVYEDLAESMSLTLTCGRYMERRNGDVDAARYKACEELLRTRNLSALATANPQKQWP